MRFHTADAMRELDAEVIRSGTPGITLMGRACRGLARELTCLEPDPHRPVVVCCGPGNNGGDGFGLALLLHRLGRPVEVWGAISPEKVKGDALVYRNEAEGEGVRFRWMPETRQWEEAERHLPPGSWLVDALLGTGVSGAPRKTIADAVRFLMIHRGSHPVVAIDAPTGLDADSGEPFDADLCVRADHTFTLGGAKLGFENDGSAAWTGGVTVVDLGFDQELLRRSGFGDWRTFGRREAAEALPPRDPTEHKGSRGHVLVIGGSPGMTGSVSMAARAALRTGSGLATVFTPRSCAAAVDASSAEIMVRAGEEAEDGSLVDQEVPLEGMDAVLLGPGLRVTGGTRKLTERLLAACRVPLVIDADALGHLVGFPEILSRAECEVYLTPHPGEMGRMFGVAPKTIQSDRSAYVRKAAERSGAQVVLKGSRSRVVTSGGVGWLNLNGNPGMASGGMGDVLAGMTASLAGQGVETERVLPLAVYLHGRAGDVAAGRSGQAGLLAGDVLEAVPSVLRYVQGR